MTNTVPGTYLLSIQHVLNVGFSGISLTFSGLWDGSPASAVLAFSLSLDAFLGSQRIRGSWHHL